MKRLYYDNYLMKEEFVEKINNAVDKLIKEKGSISVVDWNVLEYIAKQILIRQKYVHQSKILKVVPIKKEEMLKITLDFFKSIDEEFYKKAVEILLQQNKSIKMNIYNIHKIEDFRKKNELGIIEYTNDGSVQYNKGNIIINIPTNNIFRKEETGILEHQECTLEDLYLCVHEISHLFDFDLEKTKPDAEEIETGISKPKETLARALFTESTAIAFEVMLTDYLINNTNYPKSVIKEYENKRRNTSYEYTKSLYTKLLLAKEKREKGKITIEYLRGFMEQHNMSIQGLRNFMGQIVCSNRSMFFEQKYVMAGLISPTIGKLYREEGSGKLKQYLKEIKENNPDNVLSVLGVDDENGGLNKLLDNMKQRGIDLNTEER